MTVGAAACIVLLGCGDDEPPATAVVELPSTPTPDLANHDGGEALDVPDPEVLVAPGPCDGLPEGAPCDDSSVCTLDESCQGGFCVAAAALECPPPDGTMGCVVVGCDPTQGCVEVPALDEAPCDVPCYAAGRCVAGECLAVAGTEVTCPAPEDPCVESLVCEPSTGECTLPQYALACPEGTTCRAEPAPEGSTGASLSCVVTHSTLCMPCKLADVCAEPDFPGHSNACVSQGADGSFCGTDCAALDCPPGFDCVPHEDPGDTSSMQCAPSDGACSCSPAWAAMGLTTSCTVTNAHGTCLGQRGCGPGGLSDCDAKVPAPEACDGEDNDCDGLADEGLEDLCGPIGPCCIAGACKLMHQGSCELTGGNYLGVGLTCGEVSCNTMAQGACCKSSGDCTPVPAFICSQLGGAYKGDGMTCDDVDCAAPVELAACCFLSGACSVESLAVCQQLNGVWAGSGTSCGESPCLPQGACCTGPATCITTHEANCFAQEGVWTAGKGCATVSCLVSGGEGACCVPGSACTVTLPEPCTGLGGLFLLGEQCFGQCPLDEVGACCWEGAPCGLVEMDGCPPPGKWAGLGTDCDACQQPEGACCVNDKCYELTPEGCQVVDGVFKGFETTCPGACE